MENNEVKQITNVLGGAFMPSVDSTGDIAFATYKSTGYKIAMIKEFKRRIRQNSDHASNLIN
ncbi:MAG: hypothetical protein IPL53_21970 [Ignavibacteria bacterium]|nr:hypothetical protein [Ignavibacteria bacterium]